MKDIPILILLVVPLEDYHFNTTSSEVSVREVLELPVLNPERHSHE